MVSKNPFRARGFPVSSPSGVASSMAVLQCSESIPDYRKLPLCMVVQGESQGCLSQRSLFPW